MMYPSIRQQTLLIALLPMLLAVVLLDSYFLYSRFTSMEVEMINRAQLLAKQIGSSGEYALFSGNSEQAQRDVTTALKQKDVAVVAIQDASGKVIAYAGDALLDAERGFIKMRDMRGLIEDTEEFFWVREPIATLSIDLSDVDTLIGSSPDKVLGYVLVKMNKANLRKDKWEVLGVSLLISLTLILLTVFIVLRVSRRIVNPIKALNHVARSIGEGSMDMRLSPAPTIRELSELAHSINEMAKQLQKERLALEEQTELLRTNEIRLSEIINTMPVALFIKDAQSRVTLMNSACEAQWGVLFSNVVGTDASRFFPPEQVANYLARDQEVLAARKMIDFEEPIWNSEIKANRILHTFKKAVYDNKGAPLYLIGISIDVSERRLAENRLKQLNEQLEARVEASTRELRLKKEDAENANYDKSRFLAAASHDLRQPMHALGLFVGELHSKLTTPEQRKVVAKVEESVDALSNLLDALLDISKLDAGVVAPNITVFPIETLLARIAHDYILLAERKNISLQVISHTAVVNSDPILLERVLINLVSNAIRYTPEGGRIVVLCRYAGEKLRIEVRDNGVGIPAHEQQNVFREFVQLSNKERDRSKGLGLGLAIVDRIAKLLHYNVSLRSASNRGSVFAIAVPKVSSLMPEQHSNLKAGEEIAEKRAPSEFDNLEVLVIDDNPLVRKGTQGIIESWGANVSMAASLKEVKDIHGKGNFDLVICDYRLPDGDGIEIADWLKGYLKVQPPFILISGDTSPEVLKMVNERGIQLLHKPVRPAKLRSLIQYLLSQKLQE